MIRILRLALTLWLILGSVAAGAAPLATLASPSTPARLSTPALDRQDKASLQRGAALYMNYCLGCHSLRYVRYQTMAQDIGIVRADGQVATQLLVRNLMFTGASPTDRISSALLPQLSKQWFGVAAPDLTLEVAAKGVDWVYTFLTSFYADSQQPWGSNNLVFPGVAMPNVLQHLRGTRRLVHRFSPIEVAGQTAAIKPSADLVTVKKGSMTPLEFEQAMTDLVNFLAYASDPNYQQRYYVGAGVLAYLSLLLIFCYFLKKELVK